MSAIIRPTYCRYCVKHYIINQSIPSSGFQSINRPLERVSLTTPPCEKGGSMPKIEYRWKIKHPDRRPSVEGPLMPTCKKSQVFVDWFSRVPEQRKHTGDPSGESDDGWRELNESQEVQKTKKWFIWTREFTYPILRSFTFSVWEDTPTWPFGGPFSLANDPAWTLHKGKWTEDFDACLKEYLDLCRGGYDDVGRCSPKEYLYPRRLFPALRFGRLTLFVCICIFHV